MKNKLTVFWFRRDLRLEDNAGLSRALASGNPVLPVFIFDRQMLARCAEQGGRSVAYLHRAVSLLDHQLRNLGSGVATFYGTPVEVFAQLEQRYTLQAVFYNREYEPEALVRDQQVGSWLKERHISFIGSKDQVIFEAAELVKENGKPYTVYTPYAKRWKASLRPEHYCVRPTDRLAFAQHNEPGVMPLSVLGFNDVKEAYEAPMLDESRIRNFQQFRDYPAVQGTSGVGVALRLGTLSIRACVTFALQHSESWLNALIWREFFTQILFHFPQVVDRSFKPKYDLIKWRNDPEEFKRWCAGNTGYPLVDAGMRQLNQTGEMHNRVRMVAASFLCKHLLIDWRWGEAYFAAKLKDYDLAANNGNWQWSSGSGCDAAPYFRIFNPTIQLHKFDREKMYVRKWVPEYGQDEYPLPMIDHDFARTRALQVYGDALIE